MNPFGFLGSAAAKVGSDILTAAMLSVWNAGLWLLRFVLDLEDHVLTPNLAEDGPLGRLYQTTFWLALALVGILMVVQIIIALARRDGRTVGSLIVGVAQFGFVWFAWIGYGATVIAACGGLTRALMESLLQVSTWSDWNVWKPFSVSDVTDAGVAVILGLMGLLPLGLGDVMPVHRGHRLGLLVEPGVPLDAEQHEGRDDENQQEAHEELLVIANGLEHAVNILLLTEGTDDRCRPDARKNNKKGEPVFAFCALVGADGVEPPTYAL